MIRVVWHFSHPTLCLATRCVIKMLARWTARLRCGYPCLPLLFLITDFAAVFSPPCDFHRWQNKCYRFVGMDHERTSIYTLYWHIAFHYDYYLLFLKEGIEISLLYLNTRQCDNQVSINNSLHPLEQNWDNFFYYRPLTCLVQMCRLMIFIWSQWPCSRRLTSLKIQVEKDGKFYLQST